LLTFPLKRSVSLTQSPKRIFSVQHEGAAAAAAAAAASSSAGTLRSVLGMSASSNVEDARVKFRCKTDAEYQLWVRAFQYLLAGGYGFWYPWEQRDFNLDLPEEPTTIGGGSKKTRRRRKHGTLKKKKAEEPVVAANSPRNNEIEVLSAADSVE
jgi:hypothetical protein